MARTPPLLSLTLMLMLAGSASAATLDLVFKRADGSPATPPTPAAARVMQEVVWQVVSRYAATGIAG